MIEHLRNIAIFQAVAEQGSFRKAAALLKLSPSVVSHHVSSLEAQLGTALLYRSTRRMSLTDAGAELLDAAQRMTAAAQDGLSALQRRADSPTGTLSITAATPLAHPPFADNFTRFSAAYPGVSLSVHLSDNNVALEGSGFDVAIRGSVKDLDDSSYKARKIGCLDLCIFAARAYVEARPPLRDIDDLAAWDWIRTRHIPWSTVSGASHGPDPRIVLTSDNYALARHYAAAGMGFMIEAHALVADELRAGRLVQLLPDMPMPRIDVHAVYPANAPRDSLAHLFVDHIAAHSGFPR